LKALGRKYVEKALSLSRERARATSTSRVASKAKKWPFETFQQLERISHLQHSDRTTGKTFGTFRKTEMADSAMNEHSNSI
jgi:hypothetical protein